MKKIAVLGSTGSIGKNTLDIIKNFPGEFKAVALSTNSNTDLLYRQIKIFRPEYACVSDEKAAAKLKRLLRPSAVRIFTGADGLDEMAGLSGIDQVMMAISGSAALRPLISAINSAKDIALANKEALVMAGHLVMRMAARKKINICPVDSEQSAIWQCLMGNEMRQVKRLHLTASGGPFRKFSRSQLNKISVEQALKHPCWKMGRKISVDSATLMNKGLEVIEAMHLFGVSADKIKVVIHPEALIHSMVEFLDGIILAQISVTDMRLPIQYALSYPDRLQNGINSQLDFCKIKQFSFYRPDTGKFECLRLAYEAAKAGGSLPVVMNAANETCVNAFINGRIGFLAIPRIIEKVMRKHRLIKDPTLKEIFYSDEWAKAEAQKSLN
ncbi:MAG: 1-deoxy-D-xylulose-5-phosphate reductoisomerase [Candidatus Omnitrophota bacterium]|jgi:1-deoxy-D-xylulose-5-phosphate reductoisomerase|nr:MAG: 1-deoxy-D-xylulose-5-phosphate reductoisomerase [Candidatus Omnitrophota bacterium]